MESRVRRCVCSEEALSSCDIHPEPKQARRAAEHTKGEGSCLGHSGAVGTHLPGAGSRVGLAGVWVAAQA